MVREFSKGKLKYLRSHQNKEIKRTWTEWRKVLVNHKKEGVKILKECKS